MKKIIFSCLLACASSVSMAQSEYGFQVVTPGSGHEYLATALSQNGQYIAGWCSGEGSALYDVESGEFYYLEGSSEMSAVSDDGMMIGYGVNGTTAIVGYNPKTGEQIVDNTGFEAWAKACTLDASVLAGEYWDSSWSPRACYWTKDGSFYELTQPDAEEIGFGEDGDYDYSGTEAVGISEDGKIIVGVVWDWFLDGGALIWRLDDSGTYVLDPICKNLIETSFDGDRPYHQYQATAVSPNGKYVAMYLLDNGSSTTYMGRYDAETGSLVSAKYSTSCTPTRIANDGTIIGYTGDQDSQSRTALIWEPEGDIMLMSEKFPEVTDFDEWDKQQDWNFPVGISSDGRYIAGGGWYYFEEDGEDYARRASWLFDRQAYNVTTGIHTLRPDSNTPSTQNEYFSVDGRQVSAPVKGVNVLKSSDGTTKKLLVK